MSRAPSFAGVILAAGESSRMGTDKALLPWPPQLMPHSPYQSLSRLPLKGTFLSAAIDSLLQATDFVIVVVGKNEAALAPVAYANGASLITNPDPSRGQFSSLQIGLQAVLDHGRDAAVVTLIDRPPVSAATVQSLRSAFESAPPNVWAVVPEFSGKHGHPYLAGRELMQAFLHAPPTASARDIEHQHQKHIQYVTVNDPFVALNVNTPEEYAELSSRPVEKPA